MLCFQVCVVLQVSANMLISCYCLSKKKIIIKNEETIMQHFSCYKLFSVNSFGYVGVILQGDIFLNI